MWAHEWNMAWRAGAGHLTQSGQCAHRLQVEWFTENRNSQQKVRLLGGASPRGSTGFAFVVVIL
jgi:hypothetical protein